MGVMENRETFVAFIEALDWDTVYMDNPDRCILGQFGRAYPELIVWTPEMREAIYAHGYVLGGSLSGPYARLAFGWEVVFGEARDREGTIRKYFGWNKVTKEAVLNHLRRRWNLPVPKPLPQCLTDAVTHVTALEPAE